MTSSICAKRFSPFELGKHPHSCLDGSNFRAQRSMAHPPDPASHVNPVWKVWRQWSRQMIPNRICSLSRNCCAGRSSSATLCNRRDDTSPVVSSKKERHQARRDRCCWLAATVGNADDIMAIAERAMTMATVLVVCCAATFAGGVCHCSCRSG